ncbi:TIGR01906 family membrane protein [Vaginisenegalia massiliensis]|uniref:TIGR01906 family membrane protein n=1 Tax=Vaginisenegalia massiliensis TaxID=2058294 RepID=UPI000F546AC5|nr:TIGR01906 family membrane protein [Vaginisenegalia massiliensis]
MVGFRFKQGLGTLGLIISGILMASALTLLSASWLYRLVLNFYDFQTLTGLSQGQLQENFDVLMAYLLNPQISSLKMPYFSSSAGALQHFAEVKFVFHIVIIAAILATVLYFYLLYWVRKTKQVKWMQGWIRLAYISPLVVLLAIVIAFDQFFVLFHQLIFNNQLWLFDPLVDPVIQVLPESLFMLYLIMIIVIYELLIWVWDRCLKIK